jgi:hypothetical protein
MQASNKPHSIVCPCGGPMAANFDDVFGKEIRVRLEKVIGTIRPPKSRWHITTLGILLLGFYALWIAYGILLFILNHKN